MANMSDQKPVIYSTAANRSFDLQHSTVARTTTSPIAHCTSTNSSSKRTVPVKMSARVMSPVQQPKTSISHPINITWIIPADVLNYLSVARFPDQFDLLDFLQADIRQKYATLNEEQFVKLQELRKSKRVMGNFCLSSCPGKKVRLTGPVKGRPAVNRDLDMDFERMRGFGITMLICCLDDKELAFLGAPWPKYAKAAKEHNLKVLRLPMVEGSCPNSLSEVKMIVEKVNAEIKEGYNVLAHCRGGVGRAGLLAGCWMMENLLCKNVERAVSVLRQRRSIKAIETCIQAEYLVRYSVDVHKRLGIPLEIPQSFDTNLTAAQIEMASSSANYSCGSPPLSLIASLENLIISDTLLGEQKLSQPSPNDAVTDYPSPSLITFPSTPNTVSTSPRGLFLP